MREQQLLLVITVLMTVVTITATDAANSYGCNYPDGIEIINISDAGYLISYIFGSGPEPCGVGEQLTTQDLREDCYHD